MISAPGVVLPPAYRRHPMPPLPTRRAAAVLLALLLSGCAPAAPLLAPPAPEGSTTIFVVRHAERASDTDRDPLLSAEGEARARALSAALADAGVTAIYATPLRRTQHTARPLAERLGVPVQVGPASADSVAAAVLGRHRGDTVLLVGHSNTVAALVRAFGGRAEDLTSTDYDDLFVVTIPTGGRSRTVHARYGAPSR